MAIEITFTNSPVEPVGDDLYNVNTTSSGLSGANLEQTAYDAEFTIINAGIIPFLIRLWKNNDPTFSNINWLADKTFGFNPDATNIGDIFYEVV